MSIVIEKNIPIPDRKFGKGGRKLHYPLADMQVGESFAVPLIGEEYQSGKGDKATKMIAASVSRYSRIHAVKFVVRTLKDEGVVRVWRVA